MRTSNTGQVADWNVDVGRLDRYAALTFQGQEVRLGGAVVDTLSFGDLLAPRITNASGHHSAAAGGSAAGRE